jgi:hypothetical protein
VTPTGERLVAKVLAGKVHDTLDWRAHRLPRVVWLIARSARHGIESASIGRASSRSGCVPIIAGSGLEAEIFVSARRRNDEVSRTPDPSLYQQDEKHHPRRYPDCRRRRGVRTEHSWLGRQWRPNAGDHVTRTPASIIDDQGDASPADSTILEPPAIFRDHAVHFTVAAL